MPACNYDSASLPDLLPLYYRRLFPFAQYYRWLNYGGVTKNYFQNREFSFTLKDDIYVRYQSFSNQSELEKEMQKMNPYKIDIGAVYSHRPNQHNTVKSGTFQALEKELVFDIDMTDYDDVRSCCSSADICPKCWTLMTIAIRILDRALREDFGFRHCLWYLSLVKGGEETLRKVQLSDPIHPSIKESLAVVEHYFPQYALVDQDILGSKESADKVLALLPDDILLHAKPTVRKDLATFFQSERSPTKRWERLKALVQQKRTSSKKAVHTEKEIMLQYCYPRLDVNVSKGVNHLLKSPFSVHPKTGRISVPIDLRELDKFDPFDVPTISLICEELNQPRPEEEKEEVKDSEREVGERRKIRDYKRTSLAKYIKVFDNFLDGMERSRKGELLRKSDLQKDF
ncbi:hypothetical protein ANANG_G00250370 [Anguilla anguilla]|uniref:DNA primase n=1 Tax=Anguilla anguilla TaxID=7936 RepID=A0A9D3RML8_ANGAN|nr:hypothetical protein ANANG_G00250370 [Anguilla anguilla]